MCGIFAAFIKVQNLPHLIEKFTSENFKNLATRGPDKFYHCKYEIDENYCLVLAGWTLNLRSKAATVMPTEQGLLFLLGGDIWAFGSLSQ